MSTIPLAQAAELSGGTLVAVGIISVLAGIAILVRPAILNYIVAAWLIVGGILWIIAGF